MMLRQDMKLTISFVLLFSLFFLFPPNVNLHPRIEKILNSKFYFHRQIDFENYRKLDLAFPSFNDNYTINRYIETNQTYEIPYAWITPPVPRDITLQIDYTFKFCFYLTSIDKGIGIPIVKVYRYRDGKETFFRQSIGSTITNLSRSAPTIWHNNLNQSVHFEKNDRIVIRLAIFALEEGRFYFGFDCLSYPSYLLDPETVKLMPNDNPSEVFGYQNWTYQYPSSGDHYDKMDEYPHDSDSTRISTDTVTMPPPEEWDTYHMEDFDNDTLKAQYITSVTLYRTVRSTDTVYKGETAAILQVPYLWGGIWTFYQTYTDNKTTAPYSYSVFTWTHETNPKSGVNWTDWDIDYIMIGLIGQGTFKLTFPTPTIYPVRGTQTYLLVEYEPLPVGEWNGVETWFGNLITRQWIETEMWTGELISKGWYLIEVWSGTLSLFQFINIIMWILLLSLCGGFIFYLWFEKK